jgi:hypothetical protein
VVAVIDPKPNLSLAGISANIDHYESRVQTAKDCWEQELQQLQYWLDQLEQLQPTSDSVRL